MTQETKTENMRDGKSDREGRERWEAVGQGAKMIESGIPTDLCINNPEHCLIATSTVPPPRKVK